MPARALLTGGAGFIGTHLAESLVADHDVVLFDSLRRNSLAHLPGFADHPRVTVLQGDILDEDALIHAMDGVDLVIHLAAIAGVSSYQSHPLDVLEVNILGTRSVLRAVAKAGVPRVIDFSTSECFGADAMWVGDDDAFAIGPSAERRWTYATSKLAGEQFVRRYAEDAGFAYSIVRPFNVYGPRQTGEGAISNFLSAACRHEPLRVQGDGTALRAWCYVSDMVSAVRAILATPGADGEAFNIGNPTEVETTLGLARRVSRLVPGASIERVPMTGAEVRARVPSIAKATRLLGWSPRVDLDAGLRKTYEWFQEGTWSR
ncbi:MAG TPA: NAD-dependent epimerase/dehydratase family protein [Actinomycetota bacterium]|nr:NAD-dependent epimerase/dehydratase family protein [Actinomycetota bacterium]